MPGEVGDLRVAVDSIVAGRGSSVFIQGGVGTGKSWLLDRVAALADSAGVTVIRARCLTNALVADLLSDDADGAGRISGDGDAVSIAAAVVDRHRGSPTLIAIDDLHRADAISLDVVLELCRHARGVPIGVVATLRPSPEEAARECAALARHSEAILYGIAPLSLFESRELLGRSTANDWLDGLIARTGGNPLILSLVAAALESSDENAGRVEDIVMRIADRPGRIADLFDIDETARTCLEAASVLGERFRAELALDIARVGAEDAGHHALDSLCRLEILRQGPGHTLEFSQPLVQRLLYAEMTPPVRMRLHARAFEALARRGFEQRAAEHATRANLSGNDAAIRLLSRVGRAALREGAPLRAAQSSRAALELACDRATPQLHLELALALLRAGQPLKAANTLQRLASDVHIDRNARVAALRMFGEALAATGRRRGAALHLRHAAVVAGHLAPGAAAEPLVAAALLMTRHGDLEGARSLVEWALREKPREAVANDAALCQALLRSLGGDVEAIPLVQELGLTALYRLLDSAEDGDRLPPLATYCGLVLAATGQLIASDGFLSTALRSVRNPVPGGGFAGLLACRADVNLRIGRLDLAEAMSSDAVTASSAAPGDRPLTLAIRARVLLHLGRIEECRGVIAQFERLLDPREDAFAGMWARTVQAELFLLQENVHEAARVYAELIGDTERSGLVLPGMVGWEVTALESLVRAGQIGVAEDLLERQNAAAASSPSLRYAEVVSALGHGLVAEHRGTPAVAEERLRRAAALAEELPGAFERAATKQLLAGFLRRNGRSVEARRHFGHALRLAQSIGAVTLAKRITAELSVASGRRGRRTGHGVLTPQEARVVDLAARGRTNRQIAAHLWISVNTVETHLQRAFAKLGVTTRAQLADVLADVLMDEGGSVPA